jgi:hypothetical protein
MGDGDAFCSYTPEHVRRVGLWDERFCNIACHEHDYFIRSTLYNQKRTSINSKIYSDKGVRKKFNPIEFNIIKDTPSGAIRGEPSHIASKAHHGVSQAVFTRKWGESSKKIDWNKIEEPLIDSYMMYPYFEKKVETLRQQRYIV